MEFERPIRILSDIHFRHPASNVRDFGQITPLLEGAKTAVFNGDTLESLKHPEENREDRRGLEAVCESAGVRPVFINGNHDPELSPLCHLDLLGGRVLVTHGEMLFHDISPWSTQAPHLATAHSEALSALGPDALNDFEARLRASKKACFAVALTEPHMRPGIAAQIATVLAELWPPWRPLEILRVWREAPGRAALLAETFRPSARVVVIGHVHRAGVWLRRGRTIVNTGSFLPFSGCAVAEIDRDAIAVRTVARSGRDFVFSGRSRRVEVPGSECGG